MNIARQVIDASRDKIAAIEARLSGVLQPIKPRREFVRGLRQRIQIAHQPAIIQSSTNLQFILIALVSVVSGIVLVVMGVRALLSLLTALGVIHADRQMRRGRVGTSSPHA